MMATHALVTEYDDPVVRPASPASSLGTAYGPDQTSLSDSEIPNEEFEKKCLDRLALHLPRQDELEADKNPLVMVPNQAGQLVWVGDDDAMRDVDPSVPQTMSKIVIASLKSEVDRIREDELFEQTILKGSRVVLETQPSTKDIDTLMRSMMGPSLDIGSGPYMGRNSLLKPQRGITMGAGIVDGPWNNFGRPEFTFERPASAASTLDDRMKSESSAATASTVGKRSRSRIARSSRQK